MPVRRPRPARFRTILLLSVGIPLPGCAAYVNYPPVEEKDFAINDPNIAPTPEIVAVALKHVVERYPIDPPFVFNLPVGMEKRHAEKIVARVGDFGASLVTPDTIDQPAYHVSRVWVRADKATVEVLRPVIDLKPGAEAMDQRIAYQPITVKLASGLRPWHVESTRAWPVGLVDPPEMAGWEADAAATP